ncbi:hypothetical protein D3C72_1966160 [compost metagenome]
MPQAQWIELGGLMATHAKCLDHAQDFNLLLFVLAAYAAGGYRLGAALVFRQQHEVIANRGMRYISSSVAICRQLLKVGAPLFGHSVGIVQVELIELFHICSVATG